MNCEQAHNLFDAHLNGELSASLETELAAHRLNCPSCRHELALMEVAGHVLAADSTITKLDDQFADRLIACLDRGQTKQQARRPQWLRWVPPLAAAASLLLLVGYQLAEYGQRPGPKVLGFEQPGDLEITPADNTSPAFAMADPQSAQSTGAKHNTPAADADADAELAADELRHMFETSLMQTHESSQSLYEFGRATLLEMINELRLEELREPKSALPSAASARMDAKESPSTSQHDIEEL